MKLKKPNFWDLKKPNLISYLLLPLTIPIIINNLFLKYKYLTKNEKIKSICVGNIYIGGTGKTPTAIKLYNLCKKLDFKTTIGKKNYPNQLDEQILLRRKTNLILSKNRKEILKKAIQDKFDVIVFDDGLQDKDLNYDFKIVCFDSENWLGNGFLIPSGPLREKIDSLKKYDVVFLKNENSEINEIIDTIKKQNPLIKIFHTYHKPVNLDKFDVKNDYLIFSGIGNPNSFKNILKKNNLNIVKEIIFPDHYSYKDQDIITIKDTARNLNAKIITTEKDYVKLSEKNLGGLDFLEIELKIKDEDNFVKFLRSKINEKY